MEDEFVGRIQTVNMAYLFVYDMNGTQKLKKSINERGESSVIIVGNNLIAGMYIYSLILDGVIIDTKRMILTD